MARVPSVTNISKDVTVPDPRALELEAGELDVDAEIPDDFDWDALPDDDEPMPFSDEEHTSPPAQPPSKPPSNQNGHASASAPNSPHSPARIHARSDGVVADPTGLDDLEDGEIDHKKFRRKKKRKTNTERLHCEICDIYVTGQITLDSHLQGQRHMAKAAHAALRVRNQKIADQEKAEKVEKAEKAERARNQAPTEQRKPLEEWNATKSPPKPASSRLSAPAASAEHRNLPGRTDARAEGKDPYAANNLDRRTNARPEGRDPYTKSDRDRSTDGRSEARDPYSRSDRDRTTDGRSDVRDPYSSNERDRKTDVRVEVRDPYAKDPYSTKDYDRGTDVRPNVTLSDPYAENDRTSSGPEPRTAERDSRRTPQASQVPDSEGSAKEKEAEVRHGRDPYDDGRGREANEQRLSGDKSRQDVGSRMQTDASEAKKRKRVDENAEPSPAQGDKQPMNGDRERPRSYEAVGDGALRRRLSDGTRDPGQRDPYASCDASRQPGPAPVKPLPPPLVSAPAPTPAPTDQRDDRRPADQNRKFTYGSVRKESTDDGSSVIPYEWLSQPMDAKEWRDLRHYTFSKGDAVDQLAFKMLQEILLSPVLGVSSSSLAPYSRAMLGAVRNQLLSRDSDAFARFEDFPEVLSVRDDNYTRGDPEWQKSQTPEQMAVRLVGDNIVFCLNSYEDSEAASTTEPHNFPRRGSFGQQNMTKSSRDGGMAPRYQDSVEEDTLFNELYDHLLRQRMGG